MQLKAENKSGAGNFHARGAKRAQPFGKDSALCLHCINGEIKKARLSGLNNQRIILTILHIALWLCCK